MAKSADKFHVGQRCVLVLDSKSGWAPWNGELCTIVEPRTARNIWCHNCDGSDRNFQRGTQRYGITCARGDLFVRESQLRAVYDGEELSTWEKFEKSTGLNLRGELVAVKSTRPPTSPA
jgi:hypothetical protein